MNKCEKCGTTENVRRIKKLPLPNGRGGHITLTNWTYYCAPCMTIASEKFTGFIDAAVEHAKERAHERS